MDLNAQEPKLANKCIGKLSGAIYDGETNEVLQGALIRLVDFPASTSSAENGNYIISSICPGNYRIECLLIGYKNISKVIEISNYTSFDFILHADTCLLESLVIAGKRETHYAQSIVHLEGKALDQTRGLSLGASLKNIAGVNTLQTGPSIAKPVIQGMYGNRILILNNGIRHEGQQWGSEHAPEIDPFIASRITVIKGARSILYGADAIGGVILVDPKALRTIAGVGGELNLVGLTNGRQGVASGIIDYGFKRIKGLSVRLQGTYKRAGDAKAPDYYLNNTGFREYNFSLTAGYLKEKYGFQFFYSQFNTQLGILTASHTGNRTDLLEAVSRGNPSSPTGFSYDISRPFQQVGHELSKITGFYKFNAVGKLVLTYARQFNYRAEFDNHRPPTSDLKDKPQSEFKITTHTGNAILEHTLHNNISGSVGIQLIRQGNTISGTVRAFIPNFESYSGGIFLIEKWNYRKLLLEMGARYDYKWMKTYAFNNFNEIVSKEYKFANTTGSLGMSYPLRKGLNLGTTVGTSFRPPAVNELFSNGLHHGAGRFEYGNSQLKSEYALNTSILLNYNFKKVSGEINFYNNNIQNYIYLTPGLVSDSSGTISPEDEVNVRGTFYVFRYQQTHAQFSGIDATFNDTIFKNWVFSSQFSLLRPYNLDQKEYIILTPPFSAQYGITYLFKKLKKINDAYIRISHDFTAKKSKVPLYQDIKSPPPAYSLFNLESGFSFYVGRQVVDMNISVNNMFNTKYRSYLDSFRYYADAIGRNIVVRFKIPFDSAKN